MECDEWNFDEDFQLMMRAQKLKKRHFHHPMASSFGRGLRFSQFQGFQISDLPELASQLDATVTPTKTLSNDMVGRELAAPSESTKSSSGVTLHSKNSLYIPRIIELNEFKSYRKPRNVQMRIEKTASEDHDYFRNASRHSRFDLSLSLDSRASDEGHVEDQSDGHVDDSSVHGSLDTLSDISERDFAGLSYYEKLKRREKCKAKEELKLRIQKERSIEEENYRRLIDFANAHGKGASRNSAPHKQMNPQTNHPPHEITPHQIPEPNVSNEVAASSPTPEDFIIDLPEKPVSSNMIKLPDRFMKSLKLKPDSAPTNEMSPTEVALAPAVRPKEKSRILLASENRAEQKPFYGNVCLHPTAAQPQIKNELPKSLKRKEERILQPNGEFCFREFRSWPKPKNPKPKLPQGQNVVKIEFLPKSMTLIKLKDVLDFAGRNAIKKISIEQEPSSSTAYVKFYDAETAVQAISLLDGSVLGTVNEPLACCLAGS